MNKFLKQLLCSHKYESLERPDKDGKSMIHCIKCDKKKYGKISISKEVRNKYLYCNCGNDLIRDSYVETDELGLDHYICSRCNAHQICNPDIFIGNPRVSDEEYNELVLIKNHQKGDNWDNKTVYKTYCNEDLNNLSSDILQDMIDYIQEVIDNKVKIIGFINNTNTQIPGNPDIYTNALKNVKIK